jgi:hypothetical protein
MINSNKGYINLNKETPKSDWGNGDLFFLDRQYVGCPAKTAIDGFKLFRPTGNTLAYKYSCRERCSGMKTGQTYKASTQLQDVEVNNIKNTAHYLDRHTLACKDGYALQSFGLKRFQNKVRYDYTCTAAVCKARKTMYTKWESGGRNEVIYLDRQTIRMQSHSVITGFKLETHYNGGTHYRYKVDYCELKHPARSQPKNRNIQKPLPKLGGKGSIPPQYRNIQNPKQNGFQPKKFSQLPTGGRGSLPPQNRNIQNPKQNGFRGLQPQNINIQKPLPKLGGKGSIPPQYRNNYNNPRSPTSNGSIQPAPLNPPQIAANAKGKEFCSTHCDSNPAAKTKKCLENNGLIPCKRCTNKPNQSDPQVKEVCGLVCNALLIPNSPCDFYGYLNNSKKEHNIALLNKFGLQILRKFFKR